MTDDKYEWTPERVARIWAFVAINRAVNRCRETFEQRKKVEDDRIAAEAKIEKDRRKALRQLKRAG
jgi:hypothetical protein